MFTVHKMDTLQRKKSEYLFIPLQQIYDCSPTIHGFAQCEYTDNKTNTNKNDAHMHIGKRIREVLDESGQSIKWFAQNLCYSRTNVYKIFHKEAIDSDILMKISDLLKHDFFKDYSNELDLDDNNEDPKED